MEAKTTRFEMRWDQQLLDRVDEWRAEQGNFPSRSEAVRSLIEAGLSTFTPDQVRLSDGEKLNTLMLCSIIKHLDIKNEFDPEFIEDAIYGGHFWGLEWKYNGIYHGHEDNRRVVTEVVDVLDMWDFLEGGYDRLSKKDKELVEKEAEPFGKHVAFRGFDGNNESEQMGIAQFLIHKLERFARFEGRDLNSHMPSIETYRRMLNVFRPMRQKLMGGELNATQIIEILKAITHPEHRAAD